MQDLQLLGITGLNSGNLAQLQTAIRDTKDDGTEVDTVPVSAARLVDAATRAAFAAFLADGRVLSLASFQSGR
jgi:hypothetical protein